MANEIGYYTGSGTEQSVRFANDAIATLDAGIYTAGSSQSITTVRLRSRRFSGSGTIEVGLYATSAGLPTGSPIYTPVSLTFGTSVSTQTASVSWALTNGVSYALACSCADDFYYPYGATVTNGADLGLNSGLVAWNHDQYLGYRFELAGDVSSGSSPVLPAIQNHLMHQVGAAAALAATIKDRRGFLKRLPAWPWLFK